MRSLTIENFSYPALVEGWQKLWLFWKNGFANKFAQLFDYSIRSGEVIKKKRTELLSKGDIFLLDNARGHTAHTFTTMFKKFLWVIIDHPLYSPDLAPSVFRLFPYLKEDLRAGQFDSNEEMKHWNLNVTEHARPWFLPGGNIFKLFHEGASA